MDNKKWVIGAVAVVLAIVGIVIGVSAKSLLSPVVIQNVENAYFSTSGAEVDTGNYGGTTNLDSLTLSGTLTTSDLITSTLTGSNLVTATASSTGLVKVGSLTVGGAGTAMDLVKQGSASLNFAAIPAGYCSSSNITVTGAAAGDSVVLGLPTGVVASSTSSDTQEGIDWYAAVSAANTVKVIGCNVSSTSATADLSADTFKVTVISH